MKATTTTGERVTIVDIEIPFTSVLWLTLQGAGATVLMVGLLYAIGFGLGLTSGVFR